MKHNVHSTKPAVSFVQRISRKITLFLNQLAPPGYEDTTGFHFGAAPASHKRRTRLAGRVTKPVRRSHRTTRTSRATRHVNAKPPTVAVAGVRAV